MTPYDGPERRVMDTEVVNAIFRAITELQADVREMRREGKQDRHDIRNDMQGVSARVGVIERRVDETERVMRAVETLQRQMVELREAHDTDLEEMRQAQAQDRVQLGKVETRALLYGGSIGAGIGALVALVVERLMGWVARF